MRLDFQTSVVALLDASPFASGERKTVGSGFVLSADGLIATCAHVVNLEQVDEPVSLFFAAAPLPQQQQEIHSAHIIARYTRPAEVEDIAILRLDGPLPQGVAPLPLGSSLNLEGQTVRTYGFPVARPRYGLLGDCTLLGPLPAKDGRTLLQYSSQQVSRGFSGAPLWDEQRQCVVGMVTEIIGSRSQKIAGTAITLPYDPDLRQTETGLAIPVEVLREVCPEVQYSEVCPYRGLDVFLEEHAAFFFGRASYIAKLLDKLKHHVRFIPVFGPSGSGKSSLIHAGLLSQLQHNTLLDSTNWGVIISSPDSDPFEQLIGNGLPMTSQALVAGVEEWFVQHSLSTRLLLVFDQFEKLLTLCPPPLRQEFLRQIADLLSTPLPITVILVMRDDFFSQLSKLAVLNDWLNQSEGLLAVPETLTREELVEMVQRPAEVVGLRFEEGLVERIVDDALEPVSSTHTQEKGAVARSTILPLLEFALKQLWEQREHGRLLRRAYNSFGGVQGGVTSWADRVFYDLKEPERRKEVRRILVTLVHLGNEQQQLPDSRRRLPLVALYRTKQDSEHEQVHQLVEYLANGKLLVTAFERQSQQEMVEIIHDALIWEWELMRGWLKNDREFLNWLQELERRTMAWECTNPGHPAQREKEKLLQGSDLEQARAWQSKRQEDLNQGELAFIQASVYLRVRRITLRIVGGGALFAVGGSVLVPEIGQTVYKWVRAQFLPYRILASFVADRRRVYCVAWSPGDALRLASGGAAGLAHISSSAGQHIYTYRGHLLHNRPAVISITAITWSPDGFRVASGSSDGTVHVWNSDSTNPYPSFIYQQHRGLIHDVVWSPVTGSQSIASSGGFDTTVHVWNATTGKTLTSYSKHIGPVNALAWSPDGAFIASGSGQLPGVPGENAVHIWHVTNGETRWILRGHSSHILTVAWSPDSRYIASGGWDHTIKIWSAQTSEILYTYTGHTNAPVNAVSWSSDSTYIVSAGNDGLVQVWRAQDGTQIYTYREHTQAVNSVTWSPRAGDTRIASASNDTIVQIWQQK